MNDETMYVILLLQINVLLRIIVFVLFNFEFIQFSMVVFSVANGWIGSISDVELWTGMSGQWMKNQLDHSNLSRHLIRRNIKSPRLKLRIFIQWIIHDCNILSLPMVIGQCRKVNIILWSPRHYRRLSYRQAMVRSLEIHKPIPKIGNNNK